MPILCPTSLQRAQLCHSLFIDQPVGVGFSYGTQNVDTSELAAADVWKFLQIWFKDPRFHKYADRDFGIWTESYGGHYGPTFAACVRRRCCILTVNSERLQLFLAAEHRD
jgi:carboxypeptidase C (cathepsin A)